MNAPITFYFPRRKLHSLPPQTSYSFSGYAGHGRFRDAEHLCTSPSSLLFLYELWIMKNRSITVFSGLARSVCVHVCNNAGVSSFFSQSYDRSIVSLKAPTCSSCFWYITVCNEDGGLEILFALVMKARIFSAVSFDLFKYLETTITNYISVPYDINNTLKWSNFCYCTVLNNFHVSLFQNVKTEILNLVLFVILYRRNSLCCYLDW